MIEENLKKGCVIDTRDPRDIEYRQVMGAPKPFDWVAGFDVEKHLGITIKIKDQSQSESCVGQGNSYLAATVNAGITGVYDEISAKAIYSQIFIPNGGGAQIRDGVALTTTFGELLEKIVSSHKSDGSVDEAFMEDTSWITAAIVIMAKNLITKSYASVMTYTMEAWAQAIRDNNGVVAGVTGNNNNSWLTNEPQPPLMTTPQNQLWGHCLFFGKAGTDSLGKYISTPNSWGTRTKDSLHPDGWQKLRQNWFDNNARFLFNPWTLVDKIQKPMTNKLLKDSASSACGYWTPAVNEAALIVQAKADGITLPLLSNGGINWSLVKIDGTIKLN